MKFLLIFVVFVVVSFAWGIYSNRKRKQGLEGLAKSMGLRFLPEGDRNLLSEMSGFHLGSFGEGHSVRNSLSGSVQDLEVSVFEYAYSSGGSSPTTSYHAVAYVKLPANLPAFRLKPSNIFHKIGNLIGFKDINFDAHPVFSKQYHLTGEDEPAIRTVFTNRVLEFCEKQSKLHIEGKRERLIVYRNGFLKPKDAEELLRLALHLGELFRSK